MAFYNSTALPGMVLGGLVGITGSLFLGILVVVILVLLLPLAFKLEIEYSAILVLPLLLGFASVEGALFPVVGVALIYLGILVGKLIFFR